MIRIVAFLLASFALTLQAETPQLEQKLLGSWKSGPCVGRLTLKADGTFERTGYSPGNNRLKGTWKLSWDALPPTLTLNCVESDDPYFVGKPYHPRLIELTDGHLTLIHLDEKTAWPQGDLDSSKGEVVLRFERVK